METLYRECPIGSVLTLRSLYTFSRRRFPADYRFGGESHDFFEAVCVLGGRAGVTADKQVLLLSEGQLILHPPGQFHTLWSDGVEAEVIVFSFRADPFPSSGGNLYSLTPEQLGELIDVHRAAERALSFHGVSVTGIREGEETEASLVVKRLELFLLSVLSSKQSVADYRSRSAENYICAVSAMERHLGDALRVEELAAICHFSVSTLEKTMRKFSGCGAMTYYTEMRMKRAAELLREGKRVKEVSDALGFSCQNYFSLAFKKWSGKSPSSYKR